MPKPKSKPGTFLSLYDGHDEDRCGEWEFGVKYTAHEFGRGLLETNDLDTLYVALWHGGLSDEQMRMWLLAYWCYNDPISASRIVHNPSKFWQRMVEAVGDKTYKRGVYRRQYWGQQAMNSILYLKKRGIDDLFTELATAQGKRAQDVMKLVSGWTGFGPTVSFKAADMLERMGVVVTTFDVKDSSELLSDSPGKGAKIMAERAGFTGRDTPRWAIESLLKKLGHYKAPPRYERPVGFQEMETVLCKWKSHCRDKYEIGADILGKWNQFRDGRPYTDFLLEGGIRGNLW